MTQELSDADATVQSMPDASPAKWHLAHTTWFFEQFILVPTLGETIKFKKEFSYLFNSYYETVGERHPRAQRGMLTRPSLAEIFEYRHYVDQYMVKLLSETPDDIKLLLDVGIAHEQQHQELLLTDILNLFSHNPLHPALSKDIAAYKQRSAQMSLPFEWINFPGGRFNVGYEGQGFHFDCEGPAHEVILQPYKLANRSVTNREWLEFIEDGGYENPHLWLADGFDIIRRNRWSSPLYWIDNDQNGEWTIMSLYGELPLSLDAPVSNISYFEADAFAKWKGARLPTEYEWEVAAEHDHQTVGPVEYTGVLHPVPQNRQNKHTLMGLYNDVWEWTASPFNSFPRFKPSAGAIGEYNGKFMSGQMVLKGGSCATSPQHTRHTYRNFFHPDKRWQFTGLRLAQDA